MVELVAYDEPKCNATADVDVDIDGEVLPLLTPYVYGTLNEDEKSSPVASEVRCCENELWRLLCGGAPRVRNRWAVLGCDLIGERECVEFPVCGGGCACVQRLVRGLCCSAILL